MCKVCFLVCGRSFMTPDVQKPHEHKQEDDHNTARRKESAVPALCWLMLLI